MRSQTWFSSTGRVVAVILGLDMTHFFGVGTPCWGGLKGKPKGTPTHFGGGPTFKSDTPPMFLGSQDHLFKLSRIRTTCTVGDQLFACHTNPRQICLELQVGSGDRTHLPILESDSGSDLCGWHTLSCFLVRLSPVKFSIALGGVHL